MSGYDPNIFIDGPSIGDLMIDSLFDENSNFEESEESFPTKLYTLFYHSKEKSRKYICSAQVMKGSCLSSIMLTYLHLI